MAHIFRQPTSDSKGIIIFTHKEMAWFVGNENKTKSMKSLVKKYLKKGSYTIKNPSTKNNDMYKKTRKHYFIGINIGGNPVNIPRYDNCDFYLAPDEFDMKGIEHILKIPIQSRNFTPKCFYNRHQKKYWDILCISRSQKLKKLDLFLRSIRKIYDLGYDYKVLLVSPKNKNDNDKRFYTSLMDDYYNLFSYHERQNFSLLRLSSEVGFPGLSHELMAHFYNSSKVFTIFSQAEGISKAVTEALCCGLPVIVKHDLHGGARDFLDDKNSSFFETYKNAHETLIHAVKNYENFDINTEKMKQSFSEECSLEKMKEYFYTLFEKTGQKFDGNLINTDRLNIRLGAHLNEDINWSKSRFETSDILSDEQLVTFMNNLDFETFKS